jgi:ribosomal protein S27E
MGDIPEDGKIRIRCTGCGKRVKFPADQPGGTFRCPICHATIVAPLRGMNDLSLEDQPPLGAPAAAPAAQIPRAAAPKPVIVPSAPERKAPALERVNAFLLRETDRIGRLCEEVVSEPTTSVEEQTNKLQALRHAKAVHTKRYVEAVLKDLDAEISALRDDAASETQTVQVKLKRSLLERRGLQIFLSVMFELRTGVLPARTGATPDTRGSAAAPPTTPSQPAAQTPQSKPAAGPAPSDKGPGSSASPSC